MAEVSVIERKEVVMRYKVRTEHSVKFFDDLEEAQSEFRWQRHLGNEVILVDRVPGQFVPCPPSDD